MTRRIAAALGLGLVLAATGALAWAQAPADSTSPGAAAPTADAAPAADSGARADTTAAAPPSRARVARLAVGRDFDRFELGAAVAAGAFDVLGTFGYQRYIRTGGPLENWLQIELSGAANSYLNEGTASVMYLFRPLKAIRRSGMIRPILEAGPGAHLSVQVAEVKGFGETAFHSHAYLKGHVIAGLEAMLGSKWGLVARGRLTGPSDHPFDYAQIALFLR